MKLAMQSYGGNNDLDCYGGLEVRYSVNWAYYLRTLGHQVDFIHPLEMRTRTADYDFVFDAPVSEAYPCPHKPHFHCYYSPGVPDFLKGTCPCPMVHPTLTSYLLGVELDEGVPRMYSPIPYPDALLPEHSSVYGFDRKLILWANKGSFTPGFGEHRPVSSIRHLRVLAKLAPSLDFQVIFGGEAFRDLGQHADEVHSLLSVIPHQNLGKLSWSAIVELASQSKLSLHPGGITGCVMESVFAKALPVVPRSFWNFSPALQEATLLSDPLPTEEEIEEVIRRTWTDAAFYHEKHGAFQRNFADHREPGPHWQVLESFIRSGL